MDLVPSYLSMFPFLFCYVGINITFCIQIHSSKFAKKYIGEVHTEDVACRRTKEWCRVVAQKLMADMAMIGACKQRLFISRLPHYIPYDTNPPNIIIWNSIGTIKERDLHRYAARAAAP